MRNVIKKLITMICAKSIKGDDYLSKEAIDKEKHEFKDYLIKLEIDRFKKQYCDASKGQCTKRHNKLHYLDGIKINKNTKA